MTRDPSRESPHHTSDASAAHSAELSSPGIDSRYARQTLLRDIGEAGQRRLAAAHAIIVGVGALGCHTADLLVRAGVGRLTLVDRDVVERTNLQRQSLFAEADVGQPKAEAAARRLRAVNSEIELSPLVADLTGANAERLLAFHGSTLLLDGTDNFETRYLINDLAVKHGVPYLYTGVIASRGMNFPVLPKDTPCLRCIFPDPPPPGSMPTCDTAGVLGPAVTLASSRQASDAIKLLLGRADLVDRAIVEFDLWDNRHRRVALPVPQPECPCCSRRRFEFLELEPASDHAVLCGHDAVQLTPSAHALDLDAVAARWMPLGEVSRSRFMVRLRPHDQRDIDISVFPDARAIIRGTRRPEIARSLYARYLGT